MFQKYIRVSFLKVTVECDSFVFEISYNIYFSTDQNILSSLTNIRLFFIFFSFYVVVMFFNFNAQKS